MTALNPAEENRDLPPMNPNEYKCAMCRGVFEKEWTDEEAVAELQEDFGAVPIEDCAVICDDCYQKVRPDANPCALDEEPMPPLHSRALSLFTFCSIHFFTP